MQALNILNWAVIAVSFFNTITLLWLGLTVLLNADRRAWRTWLAGGGLGLSGLFFAGHSAVVGHDPGALGPDIDLWWRVSWLPVVGAPYVWYLVMSSYTGLVEAGRRRAVTIFVSLLAFLAFGLLVVADPLPTYGEVLERTPIAILTIGPAPLIALAYPIYSAVCILFSLSALRQPESSERFMGDLARTRARPWLVAASIVLLAVSLVFGAAIAWFLRQLQLRPPALFFLRSLPLLMGFDLLISGLVALAVVLTGQAIVSYEIFTGASLPRGGLRRYWRRSLILAAGYGAVVGGSFNVALDPIYRLLLATILMTLFYALLGWRSYTDRERNMEHLRPFVRSQKLYERLLAPAAPTEVDVAVPFQALCDDLLGARVAYLLALGPLAPLVGPVLTYPQHAAIPPATISELAAQFRSPQMICLPLDPMLYGGAVWAVPLWSERGLIGALLLGEKRDGGLYTQEEIEIARATGERLVDTRASAEMARRLMALQRERLQESQVVDRRARRVLHDDVLPSLHTVMLLLRRGGHGEPASTADGTAKAVALLADVHHQIANLLRDMPAAPAVEIARLGLVGALRQTVAGELRGAFDEVIWRVDADAEPALRALPPLTAEVIAYAAREAMRNADRYGRNGDPRRPLRLAVSITAADGLEIVMEDDGVGLAATTGSAVGSGQGLALHSTMMAIVGGTLTAESSPRGQTRITLRLPREVATAMPVSPQSAVSYG